MEPRPIIQSRGRRQAGAEEIGAVSSASSARGGHYNLILRIRHPELDPAKITAALGWKPDQCWKTGDQAVTPTGTKLPGMRVDGLWSKTFRYKREHRITEKITQIMGHLALHKELFHKLDQAGTQSALYLQLRGDTNIGDCIPWDILQKFVELKIAFEFETFPEWR